MLEILIHSMEVTLFCLIGILVYRTHYLYAKEYAPAKTIDAVDTIEPSDSEIIVIENNNTEVNRALSQLLHGGTARNSTYDLKMKTFQKAQVFAGVQLLEVKRNYGNLNNEDLAWLNEAIAFYIIGAVDLIGHEARCKPEIRNELATLVLKSNLNLSKATADKHLTAALYGTLNKDGAAMIRTGSKAAKTWLLKGNTPKDISLMAQLDNWGVFA